MKKLLGIHLIFIGLTLFATDIFAGVWTKTSPDTLSFTGQIDDGEYERFKAVFSDDIKTLIIDARGGPTLEGLKIAYTLIHHDITAIVRGICTSSCGNYIFLAAKRKVLDNGIVGFHGNATAFMNQEGYTDDPVEAAKLGNDADLVKVEDISWGNQIRTEELFFKKLGVSQEFFDRTQKESEDGLYYYLLPLPETFEKYGMFGVEGTQSVEVATTDPRLTALNPPVLIQ